jgi:leucyl aminopeptidase (aminopeptidase T)
LAEEIIKSAENNTPIQIVDLNTFLKRDQSDQKFFIIIFNDHFDDIFKQLVEKKEFFTKNWKRTFKISGMQNHFSEIYKYSPQELSRFTHRIADIFNQSQRAVYETEHGTYIKFDISQSEDFTVVDGIKGYDSVPGEIATYPQNAEGHVVFEGTFLSLIPFAIKYGIVKKGDLEFDIQNQTIVNVTGNNQELINDLKNHFAHHSDNAHIDEFGIGTNLGITQVYGLNSVFEERHIGLHLGLGGRERGSIHLDLLFSGGNLSCDGRMIYQNGQYLEELTDDIE